MNFKIVIPVSILFLALSALARTDTAPPEYGEFWNELSPSAKREYVVGVIHGVNAAFEAAAKNWLPENEFRSYRLENKKSERIQRVVEEAFTTVEPGMLVRVMDNLYSDPSNVHIARIDMLYLARDKTLGANISDRIANARKKALDDWKVMLKHLKGKP